jgi:hypothetical protein
VASAVEASLRNAGFKVTRDSVAGRQAVIARSRRLFVLLAVFKAGMAGREHLDRFVEEAALYATTVKGGLPSGVTAVAAALLEGGAAGAGDWAGSMTAGRRARVFPVLVDVPAGRVTCPDNPPDLRRLVDEHVTASIHRV